MSAAIDIDIRPAGPADAAALALVGQATFLETYAGALDAADILAHCRAQHGEAYYDAWLGDPENRTWIAEAREGGAPVGYATLGPAGLPGARAGDLELKRIYVLHRFHGARIGLALMARAVEAAETAGARRLLLGVFAGNARALAFYARQGFEPAGTRKFKVGASEYDDLVLGRPLAG